ncbi:hypothetical protein ANN_19808 [Periplaneta americana]|uniref:Endonuclease-reverse transcriptase n=1 Tax=Periplaneta americana TaxID=6978 RepID=A0ABQ8SC11_PERAM|nr:hypothetical protein ANN_19808 [Periplaneta americana]
MSPGSSAKSYPEFALNGLRENSGKNLNQKLLSSSLLSKNVKVRIYKTVILPVVLNGCETWTLTLREEHRVKVFENKVLRKIFGAKRDEVTGEWIKLHNAELHALYSSPDIIRNIKSRRLRWAGHVVRMGEYRNAYRVLVRRPEGKRPLGRPRRRWEYNIKMDLREMGYDGRDWINLAQDRDQWRAYVRAAINLRVVLYGCETWTLTLREEQRLKVFEIKVLRKIFGAKRDEVTGEWRKLHNTELHALYSSPDIIRNIKSRRLRWAGHVARIGEYRNAYRVLVGRPEGKIPLGRPRSRWENNIKMDLREVGYDGRDWINLAQVSNPMVSRGVPNSTDDVIDAPPVSHRCPINLQSWWQSPSAAISESDWFLYRAGISRRITSCTVVSWRCVLL